MVGAGLNAAATIAQVVDPAKDHDIVVVPGGDTAPSVDELPCFGVPDGDSARMVWPAPTDEVVFPLLSMSITQALSVAVVTSTLAAVEELPVAALLASTGELWATPLNETAIGQMRIALPPVVTTTLFKPAGGATRYHNSER